MRDFSPKKNRSSVMRIHSFQQMLSEYGTTQAEFYDGDNREEMLTTHPYSVILEGGFMELDSLDKWIEINIGPEQINLLFYGKTGYDFGFAEYFFAEEMHAKKVTEIVPRIYTIYPDSYPPNSTEKSNGYNKHIVYDPKDESAIVIGREKL
jgi:hypothetical protein